MRTASLSLVVAALITLAAAPAQAQDAEKARQLFQQGSKYYDLGQFDKAIEAWQQGYDQKPDPGFLYNIAQAYRQKQDAAKAIFFYKGYLRNSPKAHNRAEVEQKIAALQKQVGDTGGTTPPPAGTTGPPPANGALPPPPVVTVTGTTPPPASTTAVSPPPEAPPGLTPMQPAPPPFGEPPPTTVAAASPAPSAVSSQRIETMAGIGPAFWSEGVNGTAKPSFVLTLGGGYLFGGPMSRLRFRAGGLIGFTFLAANDDKSNVTFSSFMLDPTLEIRLSPSGRWFADVDVGIGLQMVSGLKANSHLLDPTVVSVSGAQGMVETRIGAGVGYRLTPELAAFSSFSQMHSEQKHNFYAPITRVEWLFALTYRL